MSEEEYIRNHSVLPFYQMFLPKENYDRLCNLIFKEGKYYSNCIYKRIKNVSCNNELYYCPMCLKETPSSLGVETVHQLPGVHVCYKHGCLLNSIQLQRTRDFVDVKDWSREASYPEVRSDVYMHLAEDAKYIIENPPGIDFETLQELILCEWFEYFKATDSLRHWQERSNPWEEYFNNLPPEFQKYKNNIYFKRFDGRGKKENPDPVEYLLFIRSICGSFENFINKYK